MNTTKEKFKNLVVGDKVTPIIDGEPINGYITVLDKNERGGVLFSKCLRFPNPGLSLIPEVCGFVYYDDLRDILINEDGNTMKFWDFSVSKATEENLATIARYKQALNQRMSISDKLFFETAKKNNLHDTVAAVARDIRVLNPVDTAGVFLNLYFGKGNFNHEQCVALACLITESILPYREQCDVLIKTLRQLSAERDQQQTPTDLHLKSEQVH